MSREFIANTSIDDREWIMLPRSTVDAIFKLMDHPWLKDSREHMRMLRREIVIPHAFTEEECRDCRKALEQRIQYLLLRKSQVDVG